MFKTDNQETFHIVLKAFGEAARQNYGGHAFEAGYLQSVIISMLPDLPKRKQKELIVDMIRATQRQEQDIIDRILQGVK